MTERLDRRGRQVVSHAGLVQLTDEAAGDGRFRRAQRNFNPVMAMAAKMTIVEVEEEILPVGAIDPDDVHLSGIFVQRLVKVPPAPEGWWPMRPAEIAARAAR